VTYKQRPLTHRREMSRSHPAPSDGEPLGAEPAEERSPQIVKTKRFAIEPMFEEDAVSRMEELGHSFFVFVNAETEQLAVLYRRRDGDYGLIEAQIEGAYTGGNRGRPTRPRGG
jgi:putative sigma-54 modulation protein